MKRLFFLALYYGVAYWLPSSCSAVGGKKLRAFSCRHIFKKCGKNVIIEPKAIFGFGRNIEIGDNSGIGIEYSVPRGTIIGEDVMMAPQGIPLPSQSHRLDSTDSNV